MYTSSLDLTGYDNIKIEFSFITNGFSSSSDDLLLEMSLDGGAYTQIEEWNYGDEFVNESRVDEALEITAPASANVRFRLRCDASNNQDLVFIDDVAISGCVSGGGQGATMAEGPDGQENEGENEPSGSAFTSINSDLTLFPNPTNDQLTVMYTLREANDVQLLITDFSGKVMQYSESYLDAGEQQTEINTRQMAPGYYYLHLLVDGTRVSKQFVVIK
jgi:hypothetical protein